MAKIGRPTLRPMVKQMLLSHMDDLKARSKVHLGSEGELCDKLGISRPVLRRAIGELRSEGRIQSLPGKGHYILEGAEPVPGMVGLILGLTHSRGVSRDSYVAEVVDGVQQGFLGTPYSLVLESIGPEHRTIPEMVKPYNNFLRGLILLPLANEDVGEMVRAVPAGVKCVVVGRSYDDPEVPCVHVDYEQGARKSLQYLLQLGHRQIGMLTRKDECVPEKLKLDAYKAMMSDADCYDARNVLRLPHDQPDQTHRIMEVFLSERKDVSALLVSSRDLLPSVLSGLRRLSVNVPDDLSLVCVGESPDARFHYPAITCVRDPVIEVSKTAARMLTDMLSGKHPDPREVSLGGELVVRDSCQSVSGF